ncbi:Retrovirus-related Pol polyprotein from transposon opus [Portunus trituberculatus]|uniref:Retrovirus-related Pol polyprotein from transposon opus n=1 Tax=Portunus trituberculatus TaxID=210409 RepID=A0A5B7GTX0_PORTR|nr:Retrovirus-related Pol polyprotein from transposon opus [Portunus trituberculatus]
MRERPFCCKSGWRLALCGSRHLTPAEAGYAPVEREALTVAWCLCKARLFLLGCPNLLIITDHRPLVKLLGERALKDIVNLRLFSLKEKILPYRFQIKYLPGKCNCTADFLSCYPALCEPPETRDEEDASDMEAAMAAAAVAALDCGDVIVLDNAAVVQGTTDDPEYQLFIAKVTAGDWHPHRAQELTCLCQYYGVRTGMKFV